MVDKQRILIVDDDANIAELISLYLMKECYETKIVGDGESALREFPSFKPNLVLLDLMLPGIDGYQVCRELRTSSQVPIIMLTAKSEDADKLMGFECGADDYLTKPFSVEELLARLRSTFRRISYMQSEQGEISTVFVNGDLKIDFAAAAAYMGEQELHLSPIEYKLLCELARNVGKVLTHQYLIKKVWENVNVSDIPSLRVYMATLRKKIEPDRENPQYIQTRVGIGYKMNRL